MLKPMMKATSSRLSLALAPSIRQYDGVTTRFSQPGLQKDNCSIVFLITSADEQFMNRNIHGLVHLTDAVVALCNCRLIV
ncbi:hypothetical protein DPMN_164523 [Dreissena polymorpha]|uniref:Uncharacterized protein n=1 Tax=Dreissena polymorpha TaxID=45954 RepID=A0A9D4EXZ3_DREPO|nr:hypothetical protein DPMN_164523 [Dreissena polymorpha]